MLMISRFLVGIAGQMVVTAIMIENTSGGIFKWTHSPELDKWIQENKAGICMVVSLFIFSLGCSTGQFVHQSVLLATRAVTYH